MRIGSRRTSIHAGTLSTSWVLEDGRLPTPVGVRVATGAAATGAAVATGAGTGVAAGAVGIAVATGVGVADETGVGVAVACAVTRVLTVAEQRTSEPPPFADPLH